jgi:hypothetical protein
MSKLAFKGALSRSFVREYHVRIRVKDGLITMQKQFSLSGMFPIRSTKHHPEHLRTICGMQEAIFKCKQTALNQIARQSAVKPKTCLKTIARAKSKKAKCLQFSCWKPSKMPNLVKTRKAKPVKRKVLQWPINIWHKLCRETHDAVNARLFKRRFNQHGRSEK